MEVYKSVKAVSSIAPSSTEGGQFGDVARGVGDIDLGLLVSTMTLANP